MDKFDVVFAAVVAAFIIAIGAAVVVDAVTSPAVVVVGSGEGVNEID